MAGIKDYLIDIQEYVWEAYVLGAKNEEDILCYVRGCMKASDEDIKIVIKEYFYDGE